MDSTQSWKELVELKVFWQKIGKHHSGFRDLFSLQLLTEASSSFQILTGQELKLERSLCIIIILK